MAYGWCSLICENYSTQYGGTKLLLLSLEAGFRHISIEGRWMESKLIHTEHHQKLASIVFSSRDGEAIADLLCAWTSWSNSHEPYPLLGICAEYLIGLHHLYPFSSRLRSHIINAIGLIGHQQFEQVEAEEFVRLLSNLDAYAGDQFGGCGWIRLRLDAIKSSKGIQHLSHSDWKWLVGCAAYWSDELETSTYSPDTMVFLVDAKEWDKLKCWVTIVWLVWPPEGGKTTEEDLENVMFSLFHQQPGALQELEEKMEKWSKQWDWIRIPESFERICKKAHDEGAQKAIL